MRKHLYIMILLALLLSVTATLAPGGSMSTAQAGVGDLVPLGDQLGDVGQYYSQVSPSMNSRVYVYNTASASRTAVISIYQDAPVNAAAYHTATCDIAANQVLYLRMNDVVSGTLTIEGGTGAGCTAGTGKVYRSLHHMKIVQSGGGADLAVSVNTWTNPSVSPDLKQVSGAYQAVPSSAVASEYVLPAVLLGRTTGWDTEIVVQNVSGVTTTVTFDVSPDSGGWFNNNVATLNPNERRVFLASQLLYAPAGGGTLEQKDGWAWMKLRAFHATNYTPQNVAVTINMFKQGLTDGKYRAEYGSERLMQFEAPLAGTELLIPGFKVDGTNSYFRVANASTWTTNITAKLYNSSGSQVGSTYTDSVNNQKAKSFAGNVFGAASGTYTLRIQSTYNVTAAAWYSSGGGHTGVTAQRVGDTDGTGTYLPFYWENHYGWQDEAQYSNTSGSGVYTGSLYKRSDGSFLSNWVFWPWGQYAQASTSFSGYNNELYAKLLGAYPLAVGRFENYSTTSDRILSYNGIAKKSGTWYVPFAPAPVVTFVDSSHIFKGTSGNPTAWNGTLGDADTDDYVFYKWDKYNTQRANCNVASGISMHKYAHSNTDPQVLGATNRIPSNCTGRPLLMFNEPYLGANVYQATSMARVLFQYQQFPGDLYCCGHVEHTNLITTNYLPLSDMSSGKPSMVKVTNVYTSAWGGTNLPIDGVHLHSYSAGDRIDTVNEKVNTTDRALLKDRLDSWGDYIDANYGTSFPVIVSEWGILAHWNDSPTREAVRSGMVDMAKLTVSESDLGSHIIKMMWFWIWDGSTGNWCEFPPFDTEPSAECYHADRLIKNVSGSPGVASKDYSSIGRCHQGIIDAYPSWPSGSSVCFQDNLSD